MLHLVALFLMEYFGNLLLEDLLCKKAAAAIQKSFAPALSSKMFFAAVWSLCVCNLKVLVALFKSLLSQQIE